MSQISSKKSANFGVNSHDHGWSCVGCEVEGPFLDCGHVARRFKASISQCTTTSFRDEPDEEQRWLKTEMVVMVTLHKTYKCRDEQVKTVAVYWYLRCRIQRLRKQFLAKLSRGARQDTNVETSGCGRVHTEGTEASQCAE